MNTKIKSILLSFLFLFLLVLPFLRNAYIISVMTLIFVYMAMGQMWNLMGGYAGLLSLGMQAFIGIGGYSLTIFSVRYGLNVYLAVLLGGILSVLFAFVVSPVLFRMNGVYFAIGSWVIAETLLILFSNWKFVGYAKNWGISSVYNMSKIQIYYTALVVGILSVVFVYLLLRSKTGLALQSIRDNADAAQAMGVKLNQTKMLCYLSASFFMGISGGVMYMMQAYIKPDAGFSINWTIAITFIVIIGGMGTIDGPIVGAVFYVILTQYLYNFPEISMIILGVISIAVIMIAPKGIMGMLYEKTGFEILSPRRNINLSMVKNKNMKVDDQ